MTEIIDRYTPHSARPLDERDQQIVAERLASRAALDRPLDGDWVDFAGGASQRISSVWGEATGDWGGVQTSPGGSWHLHESGGCSFSGSLDPVVPWHTLAPTDELRPGYVWIFHHDYMTAHNGIDVQVPLRVWRTTQEVPDPPRPRRQPSL